MDSFIVSFWKSSILAKDFLAVVLPNILYLCLNTRNVFSYFAVISLSP
jgi:hypothetical protein